MSSDSAPQTPGHVREATVDTLVDLSDSGTASTSQTLSLESKTTTGPIFESPLPTSTCFPLPPPSGSSVLVDQRDARPSPIWVPPQNQNRCLILCFDGTGDQFDADNSNIVQLVSALKKDDRTKQMVYYQSGIGTYTSTKLATPVTSKLSLTLDAAIAWNLDTHVMAGYEFLMQNYTANDRICIFGFSRGAYIARSLAGMIHKVGLLPVDNHQQVPFAYKMYTRTDATGWAQSNAFKKAFSNDVHIDFIGVWDTVDSVGFIPHRLPFTTSNTIVRTFRHAVSLDEHRTKFKANLWNWPSEEEKKLGTHTPSAPATPLLLPKHHGYTLPMIPNLSLNLGLGGHHKSNTDPGPDRDENVEQARFEKAWAQHHRKTKRTDVLEVWFAGCHCDVGGGSVPNGTRNSLARIPLRWMIRECFKADTGIMFDAQRLVALGLDPATLYPFVLPRPPALRPAAPRIESRPPRKSWVRRVFGRRPPNSSPEDCPLSPSVENARTGPTKGMEEEEDLKDALSPMYDQLKLSPFWWILEVLPFSFRTQNRDDTWATHFRANFGRPRKIPHQRPPENDPQHPQYDANHKPVVNLKVHRSVQLRREARDAKGRSYVNRAHFHCDPEWVD